MPMGGVKRAVGIGALLAEGIGDTIRVSLTDDPVEEVKVGNVILQSLGLRKRGLDLVACPSCGRAEVNVLELTQARSTRRSRRRSSRSPIRVAVMGCVVNGPGEAREADLGIAAGKGYGHLIVERRGEGQGPGGSVRARSWWPRRRRWRESRRRSPRRADPSGPKLPRRRRREHHPQDRRLRPPQDRRGPPLEEQEQRPTHDDRPELAPGSKAFLQRREGERRS